MRIKSLFVIFSFFCGLLIVNLFNIQIVHYTHWSKSSRQNIIRIIPQIGARGKILDRNNKIIADSKIKFNLAIIPQEVKNKEMLFTRLSSLLDLSADTIAKRFKKGYVNPFSPLIIESFIDKEKVIMLEQLKEELPGAIVQTDFYRAYPYNDATAHLIGYVAKISKNKLTQLKTYGYTPELIVGYSGAEEYQDLHLQSQAGGAIYEVNNLAKAVRLLGIKSPIPGNDLTLTIDIEIQKIVQNLLNSYRGAVLIMDYNNGEVIALASSPTFDPNNFILQEDSSKINSILDDTDKAMLNRAISAEYSPGSTFKVLLALAGLQSKAINLNERVFCAGAIVVGNKTFACWDKHGSQNVVEALANSCNVFFYRLGLRLGLPTIAKYADYIGLNKKTGIDLPYEKSGFIPGVSKYFLKSKRHWYPGDTANVSIGQGEVLITPIQLLSLMAIVANGGKLVHPHLIYKKEMKAYASLKFDASVLNIIRQGLRRAVSDERGTAHILAMDGFIISGKTGTVQVVSAQNHGWFAGYIQKPSWAVCILLENVGGSYIACHLFKNILIELKNKEVLNVYK